MSTNVLSLNKCNLDVIALVDKEICVNISLIPKCHDISTHIVVDKSTNFNDHSEYYDNSWITVVRDYNFNKSDHKRSDVPVSGNYIKINQWTQVAPLLQWPKYLITDLFLAT